MNKNIAAVLTLVCAALVFGSCASFKQVVFDEALPVEQSSHLFIYGGIEVTSYNGITVPAKKSFGNTASTWHDVVLPPGETEFALDLYWNYSSFVYTASNVHFRYMFEPGADYTITFTSRGGPDNDTWGVKIYRQTLPKAGWPKEDNWIAFAAFYK